MACTRSQAAQDQVVLEARKAATYREELTAQEGAAKTARAQAKRLASRHAATLEALNARARQVASLRADLEKLLQGQVRASGWHTGGLERGGGCAHDTAAACWEFLDEE